MIDWTDPRAKGLRCYMWMDDCEVATVRLERLDPLIPEAPYVCDVAESHFKNCRVAKGEKTTYDGRGQPVPDGVDIKYWLKEKYESIKGAPHEGKSQSLDWTSIAYYQVQEMRDESDTRGEPDYGDGQNLRVGEDGYE